MCTLIIGRDVIAPGTVLLAANRDEDPRRPTDPPGVLAPNPRVVGGRDQVAGGTWLAVRGREAAIAMLNRYDPSARDTHPPSGVRAKELRSRGLLALDVATVAEDFPERIDLPPEHRRLLEAIHARSGSVVPGAALSRAWVGVSEGAYAPFSLVFAAPAACWLLALDAGQPPRIEALGEGWHVITHRDLDDRAEPRTARVLDALAGFRPGSVDEAMERLGELLRAHDPPPVCLHEGRMVTVSSSMVWLARDDARYLHAEGRPCERPYQDRTPLLIHHPHVEATKQLENQVALVTGGSRGLGLSIARALAAEGAAVSCVARPGAELDRAVAALKAAGARAITAPADVTREAEVEAAVRRTVETWGRLDLVILNAGTWQGAPLHETTEKLWDQLIDLNLKGAFLTLKHALPWLIERRRGTVVGIGSLGALVGQPGSAAYAASKWGLRGLLESAALEVRKHGVRVALVHPHNMNTAGPPIAPGSAERIRNVDPEDVARAVAFLCTAPDHVAMGHLTVWPIAAGISATMTPP